MSATKKTPSDELRAVVERLQAKYGPLERERPKLTLIQGGRDDA